MVGAVSPLHSDCPRRAPLLTACHHLTIARAVKSCLQQIGPPVQHVARGLFKLIGSRRGPLALTLILIEYVRAATSTPTTAILLPIGLIEWLSPGPGQRCGDGGERRPVGKPDMESLGTIRTRSEPVGDRLPTASGASLALAESYW